MTTKFKDKTILVTGGTGSIGRDLVERLLVYGENGTPERVIIFSRDEHKQFELSKRIRDPRLDFKLGDVRDYISLADAVTDADFIFHTAAMKHVGACELQPNEAVMTNVIGASNIASIISHYDCKVETVVLCSTDKACEPTSVMGMTKAIQEKIFRNGVENTVGTKFVTCRFGNIPGTRGSVIPLFREIINLGHLLPVTDPQMTRFILPQTLAVELLIEAAVRGQHGEIFVPVMRSCTIGMLAEVMVNMLRGKGTEIVGPREGEKTHEMIISRDESRRLASKSESHFILQPLNDRLAAEAFEYRSDAQSCLIHSEAELEATLKGIGVL